MEVYIKTFLKRPKCTISRMYIDECYICDTLEDTYRELPKICPNTSKGLECKCPQKLKGITCIPEGVYKAVYSKSPKLQRFLLRIMDVPHFIGILIHAGNDNVDTEGCILPGIWNKDKPDVIANSKVTEQKLNDIWRSVDSFKSVKNTHEEINVTVDRDIDAPLPFNVNTDIIDAAQAIMKEYVKKTPKF